MFDVVRSIYIPYLHNSIGHYKSVAFIITQPRKLISRTFNLRNENCMNGNINLRPQMRRVVIFFLLLFIQLIGGNDFAHAGTIDIGSFLSSVHTEKVTRPESTIEDYNDLLAEDTGIIGKNATFNSVDDEDENEDLIKKHISTAKCFLAFSFAFLLSHRFGCSIKHLSLSTPPSFTGSCKYIYHRALRL